MLSEGTHMYRVVDAQLQTLFWAPRKQGNSSTQLAQC